MKVLVVLMLSIFILSGCYAQRANINFSEHEIYSGDNPGNKEFEEIAPVDGVNQTWVWEDCDESVLKAIEQMKEQAEHQDANKIFSVRFYDNEDWVKRPVCFKAWWMLLMSSRVQGVAAKVD